MDAIDNDNAKVSDSNSPRPSWETTRPAAQTGRPASPSSTSQSSSTPPARAYVPPPAAPPVSYVPPAREAAAFDTSVKYDLAGNPIPGTSQPVAATPNFGYSAGNSTGVWPPAPSSPYGAGQNTVGYGTDRVAKLKWNWGAFLIPFWWSIFNGQKGIATGIVVINVLSRALPAPYYWGPAVASVGISIYLGVMGHRLAWSSGRFGGDYERFIGTQRTWMLWGFGLIGAVFVLALVAAIVFPVFLAAMHGAHPAPYNPGSGFGGHPNNFGGSRGAIP